MEIQMQGASHELGQCLPVRNDKLAISSGELVFTSFHDSAEQSKSNSSVAGIDVNANTYLAHERFIMKIEM